MVVKPVHAIAVIEDADGAARAVSDKAVKHPIQVPHKSGIFFVEVHKVC